MYAGVLFGISSHILRGASSDILSGIYIYIYIQTNLLQIFWRSIPGASSDIFFHVLSAIFMTFALPNRLTLHPAKLLTSFLAHLLTSSMAIYLAYLLGFCLASLLTLFPAFTIHSTSSIISGISTLAGVTSFLAFLWAYILAPFSVYLLTSFLAF